ncbi:MAG: YdcF family protein, partial [Thermoanaerobaculia bacterium]|nr:YdcF family protein [Thermoanaerobaculia bacterium]
GGLTGTARRSEAAAGREFLLARGVAGDRIWVEERSRFTLENLYYVRDSLRELGLRRLIVVSDPLHLARAATMARGLGLDVVCSPARAAPPPPGSAAWWLRALREGFLLHWYHVGLAYSRAIRSRRLLSRVS